MARYLLAPTSTSSALLPKDAAKNSPPSRTLRLPVLGSRSGNARPIMAVASEQTATPAKYPKVAAPTTGPIPAAELLGVIEAAAKAGADVIMEAVNKPRNIHYKGVADLVTDTDKLSESVILEVVTKNFKNHLILGEEGGLIGDSLSEYLWCIDPLDGTTNFAHGYPSFSVSIGVLFRGKPAASTVLEFCGGPMCWSTRTISASSGGGAYCNGQRIHVSQTDKVEQSLLVTGFGYEHDDAWTTNINLFKEFTDISRGVRRLGSAAADMSHVGLGITEAYWEYRLKPWDMAAGVLIVEEAGGVLLDRIGPPTEDLKKKGIDFSLWFKPDKLRVEAPAYYLITRPRWKLCTCRNVLQEAPSHDAKVNSYTYSERKNRKKDGAYIDKDGVARTFDRKKISRKRGGAIKGRGWKYGSGFVDGVFPVLSPMAQDILEFVQKGTDVAKIWESLDNIPRAHDLWDDIVNVAVQLRLNRQWEPIITVCEWILYRSSFRPDIICYNLLIDAYGRKRELSKAESIYMALLEANCVPTEDTYALLLRAYCNAGQLHRAEGVISEMQENGIPPSATVYNAYLDGLLKARCAEKAVEVYQRMKKERCRTNTETYTLMINVYGKAKQPMSSLKVFNEMKAIGCKPNICTYTALVNAFAREGLCEKAEEVFEEMQRAGLEPDVYAYNALMEAYSRAGFPQGASEIFSLMEHMGCEPDRASYNILVDAYGRAGLHQEAEAAFQELKQVGMRPTMKSHMLLLSAHAKAGNVSRCEEVMAQLHKSGLRPDTFALNAMLNAYGRAGRLDDMERLVAAMERRDGGAAPDIGTYNVLVNVYGRAGYLDRMEAAFGAVAARGLAADVVTWTSRIGAYARKKEYGRCLEIFEEMVDAGCYPDAGTAKVLLGACSDERQVEQVTAIVRSMHKDAKTLFKL
ncbi:pentatricopeptide repeat-containing protein [Panicum miliaceum]|uniref:Pentatricopeptide repeat-containing protein n=1 Tax=Panicum miliaceum TaxID=4540 RepID=A0A3L6QGF9_PANMI|nr:pentatricopeptide repeat-containing protein [Panicum miliaceum]